MKTQPAIDLPSTAPLRSTPAVVKFLTYWKVYLDEVPEITARARRIALKDGRDTVCMNDVQAAWTQVIGPLWCEGMET